jgi:hypothetical protein
MVCASWRSRRSSREWSKISWPAEQVAAAVPGALRPQRATAIRFYHARSLAQDRVAGHLTFDMHRKQQVDDRAD